MKDKLQMRDEPCPKNCKHWNGSGGCDLGWVVYCGGKNLTVEDEGKIKPTQWLVYEDGEWVDKVRP